MESRRDAVGQQPRSVAVLTGGQGPERSGSIASGEAAAEVLSRMSSDVSVLDIAEGAGLADLGSYDLAFLATHGWIGEDGKLQGLLEVAQVPYTGSGVLASAIAMHKPTANIVFEQRGLHVPVYRTVERTDAHFVGARKWAADRGFPLFAKPASGGGSLGSRILRTEEDVEELLDELAADLTGDEFLVSDMVVGTEVSVGLLWCRGHLRVLPILATEHDASFYDHAVKHDPSRRRHTCPAELRSEITQRVRDHARRAFHALRCHGVARVDFIVDAAGIPWILEVNTVPGMSRQGNLATMAAADGISYDEMIWSVASTAFAKPKQRYRP